MSYQNRAPSGNAIISYDRNKESKATRLQLEFSIVTLQSECLDVEGGGKCGKRLAKWHRSVHRKRTEGRSTCKSQCLEHKISTIKKKNNIHRCPKVPFRRIDSGTILVLSHDLCLSYPPSQTTISIPDCAVMCGLTLWPNKSHFRGYRVYIYGYKKEKNAACKHRFKIMPLSLFPF